MLQPLQLDALQMGHEEFVAAHPEPVLVKRPGRATVATPSPIDYETCVIRRPTDPEFSASWRFYPVRKMPENPYPSRISVGRARNCDIVMRVPQVSKLHAHITRGESGDYLLTDNDSSNGTAIDGVELQPKTPTPLPLGCTLVLAETVTLELLTAHQVYGLLRTLQAA